MDIPKIIHHHKVFFKNQQTKNIAFRKKSLQNLKREIIRNEAVITEALYKDFKKSAFESYATEIGIVLAEIDLIIKNINAWAKPKTVLPSLLNFPSWSKIYKEPFGSVLIIAPWNYPFQLAIAPLIGAIAGGNTIVLKPSELTPHTSKVIANLIATVFDEDYVKVIEGDVKVAQELLEQRWDYIFFTGSVQVGKIVAKAAANNLTPTTLELGGKSPCIIDKSANIKLAAKRLVWGKLINGGQTCIAPDYILIHESVKEQFVAHFKKEVENAYGKDPQKSNDYPRIINSKNFKRLQLMLSNEDILLGGETMEEDLYVAPTLLNNPDLDSEVMKDEIFGPIMPVLNYTSIEEIDIIISHFEKPLSFYVFTKNNAFAKNMITKYSFGGGVINDTIVHFANHRLPFGGVGHSGIGAYHGKASFDTFTHCKGVTRRYNWLDIPLKYAPYKGKLKTIKFFLKYFS
ncbi:MAG: aldehyde dehydrogenase [Flavobacteriaceae bacterium]|nr:aldehyde dehydrogenase [Flavobacteriaceae bacterium]